MYCVFSLFFLESGHCYDYGGKKIRVERMLLCELLTFLKRKGLRVTPTQVHYAQVMEYVQRPRKDAAGNYDYSLHAVQYETYFKSVKDRKDSKKK